jgi:hypothetical protein
MKKLTLVLVAFAMACVTASAQKTVIKTEQFSDTQARMLEVTAKSYVRPLVVDLVVAKGQTRKIYNHTYQRTEVDVAMDGNLDNLRSRSIYDAASQWGCDAVVAATFKIELTPDRAGYAVEMRGFPANFDPQSWHPMNESDFKWMQVDQAISIDKLNDPDRAGAVIRNVRK